MDVPLRPSHQIAQWAWRFEMNSNNEAIMCAMVDIAVEEVDGLQNITDLSIASIVLRRISAKLSIIETFKRIRASRFPDELTKLLPKLYCVTATQIEPLLQELFKPASLGFENQNEDQIHALISDLYWETLINGQIKGGEFARAWDNLKRSFRGYKPISINDYDPMIDTPIYGEVERGAASIESILSMLNDLYRAMQNGQLIPDLLHAPIPRVTTNGWAESPSGILFARAMNGYSKSGFLTHGLQIVIIAGYFKEKKKKRAKE